MRDAANVGRRRKRPMTIEQVPSYLADFPKPVEILLAAALAWWIRGWYDRRAERASLRRELFREYMILTDTNSNRLYALHRSGATRLSKGDFEKLVTELSKAGRPPIKDTQEDSLISDIGLYQALRTAGRHQVEFSSDLELERWLLKKMAEREDQKLPSDVRSTVKALNKDRKPNS